MRVSFLMFALCMCADDFMRACFVAPASDPSSQAKV